MGTASLGKLIFHAHSAGNSCEYIIIVTSLTKGFCQFRHRYNIGITRSYGHVVAFQWRGTGQHDIRVFCERVPTPFVNDDCLWLLPSLHHQVQVLMVVKRIASCPPNQFRIRVFITNPIKIKRLPRVQQEISDPCHWDEVLNGVLALWKRSARNDVVVSTDEIHRTIPKAKSATRQPNLAQHRGQSDGHPEGLLSMVLSGERPTDRDHRSHPCHAPGKRADRIGRNLADASGPIGGLRNPVRLAHQIW